MRVLFSFFLFLISYAACAQLDPVNWSFDVQQVNDQEFDVIFTADIAHGWSVYSQHMDATAGPIPTTFEFQATSSIKAIGKTQEVGNKQEVYDEIFGINLIKFTRKAKFIQRFSTTSSGQAVKGKLTYMTCNGKSCLPPTDVPFDITLE